MAKREEGVKGLEAGKARREPGEADGVRRRAKDKADGIKRARPSVWTHESPDITTCRRVHDVPFYGRTHTTRVPFLSPVLSPFRLTRNRLVNTSYVRRRSVLPVLGWSLVSVTWTLCEAASIKPHFYSGALHSLWSPGFPLPLTHWSITTHILCSRHRIRTRPSMSRCILRVQLRTRDFDTLARVYIYVCMYTHTSAHFVGEKNARPRLDTSDSKIFTGRFYAQTRMDYGNCHAHNRAETA